MNLVQAEFIIFIAMLVVFIAGTFKLKLPVGISMMLAAISGAVFSGDGLALRHLVEGSFVYLDTVLIIATSMIFMKFVQESGALDSLNKSIIRRFHKNNVLLLFFLMLVVMFPGMITGSTTTAIIASGTLVAPVLIEMGIPKTTTAAIIALGGSLGMIAPPVNVPAMIMGGGIDMPYVGFEIPLLLLSIPMAAFSVLYLGLRHVKGFNPEALSEILESKSSNKYGFKIYLPIITVIVLMVVTKVFTGTFPDLGMPLIFVIGSVVAIFCGKRINIIKAIKEAVQSALPVMAILMGVGMIIQIMTLTGVRGLIVIKSLDLPVVLLYIVMALVVPLFGAISSFGSASVLGVPFLLAMISKDPIIMASGLSLLTSVGDILPPLGFFAAKVVGVEYSKMLKEMIVPIILCIIYGMIFILFANQIGAIIL